MRIELIRLILTLRLSNFLRNSTILFHRFLYWVTCFLRITVLLLCRSQARTISSPVDYDELEHVFLILLVTGIATKPWLSGNMLPNIKTCKNIWIETIKLLELTKFTSKIYQFTLILYGVAVHCDRGRFSVHSLFIEKYLILHMLATCKICKALLPHCSCGGRSWGERHHPSIAATLL